MRPGFSLVELLVTMTVMGLVMALVSPMVMSSREVVRDDQLRTAVNQSLRGGSDLIGADIRTAGERFPPGTTLRLPPIEITVGDEDTPDELILRRNLWEGTLPVCQTINAGAAGPAEILVVGDDAWHLANPGHPECEQPLVAPDDWPENLQAVQQLADSIGAGGALRGYIFNPADGVGEFIDFEVLADADDTGEINRTDTPDYANDYPLENRSRIYILEERRYRIRDDVLELVVNGDAANALRATADVIDLRARYVLADGDTAAALPAGVTWKDLRAVELTLNTVAARGPEQIERVLTSRYFPRNILSRWN